MAKVQPITEPVCTDPAPTIIHHLLEARLKKICEWRERALDWSDPEGVHKMRVATRRLRSALSDFKPYLNKDLVPMRRLKTLAKTLGDVRDEDVAIAALEELASQAGSEVANGIEQLLEARRHERLRGRSRLEAVISEAALADFSGESHSKLGALARTSSWAREYRNQTFAEIGAGIIDLRLKRLIKAGGAFYRPHRSKKLHRLRMLAKRLRYALEVFAFCGGPEFKQAAKEIAHLQTSLGALHDCDVWIANIGAAHKQNTAADGRPDLSHSAADVWLLEHFVTLRTRYYCEAINRWQAWQTEGFLDRLRAMTNADPDSPRQNEIRREREEPFLAGNEQMKLIFIHGAPAVGKLTVARELARLNGFRLFHNHLTVDLVSSLFPFGSEPFVRLREEIWLAAFRDAARHDLSLIFTFNPESTVRETFIQQTLDVVTAAGGKVIFVELSCAPDELERRMTDPSRAEFGKLSSVEQYRKLLDAGAFGFPSLPDSGLHLDTTAISPETAARLIDEHVSGFTSKE